MVSNFRFFFSHISFSSPVTPSPSPLKNRILVLQRFKNVQPRPLKTEKPPEKE